MTKDQVYVWMTAWLKAHGEVDPAVLSPETNVLDIGITSVKLIAMLGELEEKLGVTLDPQLIFEHETLDALSEHLSQK